MRKWLWFGAASAFLGAAGVWWYTSHQETSTRRRVLDHLVQAPAHIRVAPPGRNVNDEETSDAVEPSIVETSEPDAPSRQGPWTFEVLPLPRVVLMPGMEQPPRPDAEVNRFLRMPYADEEEILDGMFPPLGHILESVLRKLKLFEDEPTNPAEESETKEVPTPTVDPETKPETDPAMDYHRLHPSCPYTGGCPYPYSRRP